MRVLIDIGKFKATGNASKDVEALAVLVQKTFEDMASKVVAKDDLPKVEGTLDLTNSNKTVTIKNGFVTKIE